jgi:AraC-like DNA-binding protein
MRECSLSLGMEEQPYFQTLSIKNQYLFDRLLKNHKTLENSSSKLNSAIQSKKCSNMIREQCQNIKLSKEELRLVLIDLINLYSSKKSLLIGSKSLEQVECMKKYLVNHYKEHENLDEVAKKLYVSTSTFAHKFSSILNITPDCYRRMLQLEYSKTLLAEGRTVLDVTKLAGFSNLSHFSSRFKYYFGLTPLTYKGCLVNENLLI